MLAKSGNIIWRNGLKSSLSPVLRQFSALYSSPKQIENHQLDLQIQELNQELEIVFGASGGDEQASVFAVSTESSTSSSLAFNQSMDNALKEPVRRSPERLTHVDANGKVAMVDVSEKSLNTRVAVASGKVLLGPVAFPLVSSNKISKGDVLTVAKLAGILGAKQTGSLIPLCHNITLSNVQVDVDLDEGEQSAVIKAEATAVGATGVEMEALTAVSIAALTIYDMCKAVSKHISISSIQLESKTGGKSGNWCRNGDNV